MFGLKRKAKLWREAFTAGLSNTCNVTATVSGKRVLSWRGTPTQKDDALKTFPLIRDKMMPGVKLESFADAIIASIHDEGMSPDDVGANVQRLAMLWRLFTAPVHHDDKGFTYGDLVAVMNFHVAFELQEQANQCRVRFVVNTATS